ncbi:hypothetical protein EJD97_020097 [Solanum chilense]|uniref:Uncharacterized protein n=1 Tax=Solanum chilense TaxID=4083 RepID=A0A6N2B0X8_SOLCI|nr:hypothetical protein EJD97_020097 [Solanum chilense]
MRARSKVHLRKSRKWSNTTHPEATGRYSVPVTSRPYFRTKREKDHKALRHKLLENKNCDGKDEGWNYN